VVLVPVLVPLVDQPGRFVQRLTGLGCLAQTVVGHGQDRIPERPRGPVEFCRQGLPQPPDRLLMLPGAVMSNPKDGEIKPGPGVAAHNVLCQFHQGGQIGVGV
jgi:hypothetical protein